MTDAAARIKQELESMGYAPVLESHNANYPCVIVTDYDVKNGRFRGEQFRLGISMSGGEVWPDYPPHFIHLSPPLPEAPRDGAIYGNYSLVGADGREHHWHVLSRPPGPFWDNLATKSMRAYMEHIHRFWENV